MRFNIILIQPNIRIDLISEAKSEWRLRSYDRTCAYGDCEERQRAHGAVWASAYDFGISLCLTVENLIFYR